MPPVPQIGTSAIRKEGRAKVLGKTRYTDDKTFRCLLHGAVVRSPVPRGRLKGITFEPGIPWKDFVIVTAKDLQEKGFTNQVASIVGDQPFLVEEEIHHTEEAILLLAHEDRYLLEEARRHVKLDIEELPAVLDIESSLAKQAIVWGEDNVIKRILIERGDPAEAQKAAAHVFDGEYRTAAQEQLYIEPNGLIAIAQHGDCQDNLTILGSLQCPYYVHGAMKQLFGLADDRVRIVQMDTGGAFGGKEDYPSVLAGYAALLSWKSQRPVKIIYDREEDMAVTTKRHPSRTRIRSAFDAEGQLLALDIDFALDAGAYTTLSPVVLSRGALHACGVYRCPNVRVLARAVATNTPPNGAFRGFGAPQSLFALERHMDEAALRMGLDPVELRRKNFLKIGDAMSTGQIVTENVDLAGLMDRTLAKLGYFEKREAARVHNATDDPVKKGVGFSVFMHGCGFTGSGEGIMASVAGVEGTHEGRVAVLAASTEIGQGKDTVFSQIAADALNLPYDMVEVAQPDTKIVPNSGPTVASRSTMVVGKLVQTAAIALKQTLVQGGFLKEPYGAAVFQDAVKRYLALNHTLRCYSQYHTPPQIVWDDEHHRGDAYPTYSWACYAAEVSVDTVTCEVKVDDFVAAQEVGKVINPTLAEGQIEGGVAQGIGYGLWEDVQFTRGHMVNTQMTNYIMATSADLPRIRVVFEENPHPMGPGGAKGIGELPMDGPAPALAAAVAMATGLDDLREIPLTPERLAAKMEVSRG